MTLSSEAPRIGAARGEWRWAARAGTVVHGLSAALAALAGVAIIGLMLATVADVAKRKASGGAIQGVIEGSSLILPGIAFLGLAWAQHDGAHVATTLATGRMPRRVAAGVRAAGLTVAWVGLLWLCVATWREGLTSVQNHEYQLGVLQLPVWPSKLAIALGVAALLTELALELVLLIGECLGRETPALQGPASQASTE